MESPVMKSAHALKPPVSVVSDSSDCAQDYIADISGLITLVTSAVSSTPICSLWLLDTVNGEEKMELKASVRMPFNAFNNKTLGLNEGVVGYVAAREHPLSIEDVTRYPRFLEKDLAVKFHLVSLLSIPMIRENTTVTGVLNCYTDYPHHFDRKEIHRIQAVANQAATVIGTARWMAGSGEIQKTGDHPDFMEKATRVISRKRNIDTHEARTWIQQCSRNYGKPARHIAEAIVLSTA